MPRINFFVSLKKIHTDNYYFQKKCKYLNNCMSILEAHNEYIRNKNSRKYISYNYNLYKFNLLNYENFLHFIFV